MKCSRHSQTSGPRLRIVLGSQEPKHKHEQFLYCIRRRKTITLFGWQATDTSILVNNFSLIRSLTLLIPTLGYSAVFPVNLSPIVFDPTGCFIWQSFWIFLYLGRQKNHATSHLYPTGPGFLNGLPSCHGTYLRNNGASERWLNQFIDLLSHSLSH
jgi:hypothetical protein